MKLPNMLNAKLRNNSEVKTISFNIPLNLKEIGKNKKYYLRTYGCQMNEHDSEQLKGILTSALFTETYNICPGCNRREGVI